MEALIARGYNVIPVNPNEQDNLILGRLCYASLKAIKKPIDMVDIFRSSEAAFGITEDAVHMGVQVIWMQLGIRNFAAAKLAEDSGLKVVMDRCPKVELPRLGLAPQPETETETETEADSETAPETE